MSKQNKTQKEIIKPSFVIIFIVISTCIVSFFFGSSMITLNPERRFDLIDRIIDNFADKSSEEMGVDKWYAVQVLDFKYDCFEHIIRMGKILDNYIEDPDLIENEILSVAFYAEIESLRFLNESLMKIVPKPSANVDAQLMLIDKALDSLAVDFGSFLAEDGIAMIDLEDRFATIQYLISALDTAI